MPLTTVPTGSFGFFEAMTSPTAPAFMVLPSSNPAA